MTKRDRPARASQEPPGVALRRTDLDDAVVSHTASIRRHGRRAVLAVVMGGVFGAFAGDVGPQAYSIAAGFVGWGALSATRVAQAWSRRKAARRERSALSLPTSWDEPYDTTS